MSTHPPGVPPTHVTHTPSPQMPMSLLFGKILGKVEIWEVAKIAAMLPENVITMQSGSLPAGLK